MNYFLVEWKEYTSWSIRLIKEGLFYWNGTCSWNKWNIHFSPHKNILMIALINILFLPMHQFFLIYRQYNISKCIYVVLIYLKCFICLLFRSSFKLPSYFETSACYIGNWMYFDVCEWRWVLQICKLQEKLSLRRERKLRVTSCYTSWWAWTDRSAPRLWSLRITWTK